MNYCLDSKELETMLKSHPNKWDSEDEILRLLVDSATQWQDKLVCLTLSFARVIERQIDQTSSALKIISTLFSMPDNLFLEIEECGEKFVDYMLRHELSNERDLEKTLLVIAQDLSDYRYDKTTIRN